MRSVFWPVLTGVSALLLVARAEAQSTDAPLTLNRALQRAMAQQPELRGFAFELHAQEARLGEASLRPQTTAELLVEDAAGTGSRRGIDSAQTTLSLSSVIELGDKRGARVAAAEAQRARLLTSHAVHQLDVAAEVARRFVQTLEASESMRISEDGLRLSEQTQAAVQRRVKAALAPAVEVARAEVRSEQAKLESEHAEHELESSRRYLAAAMGDRNVRFGDTQGDLYATTPVASLDDLLARIESSPDFLLFADEARLRDAEVRIAELKRNADVRAQLGVRRYEEGDDLALVAGFSMPLNAGRRASYGLDVTRAERARIDSEREVSFLRVQSQLFAEYRELEHARLEMTTLREKIIPQLQDALEKTEYAYQRGRYTYLEWTDVQRELLDARRRLVAVAANYHLLRIEIERLSGQSLAAHGVTP